MGLAIMIDITNSSCTIHIIIPTNHSATIMQPLLYIIYTY